MRKLLCLGTAVLFAIVAMHHSFAQDDGPREGRPPEGRGEGRPPEGRGEGRPPEGRGEGRPPEGRGNFGRFTPPPNPFMEALDADKDGEISAEELTNAVAALKALDKNEDGKLSGEEIRPPRPTFGSGGFGRGGFGGGPGGGPGGGGDRGNMVERMMQLDENKDGKIARSELPEFLRDRFMERADTNKDEFLDKAELEALSQNREREGGEGRGEGDRPRDENRRPERPE